jgi:hypothetical protein
MDSTFTVINIINLLVKKKREIIIFVLLALIVSTISAYLIKPKYKSEAILYPTNILPYSVESQTEQMLQLLQSDYIMETIIKEFDLPARYDINMQNKGAKAAIVREYESNIGVQKTEYESVYLKVLDQDPEVATKIANRIIQIMNEKTRALQRSKLLELVALNKNNFDAEKKILDSLMIVRDTLRTKYHILDYSVQVKEAYRSYFSNKNETAKELIRNMEIMGEKWDEVNHELARVRELTKGFKTEYEKTLYDSRKLITYANVVVEPFPNDKKAYPIRWLIVLSSTLSALVLAVLILVLKEFNPLKTKA